MAEPARGPYLGPRTFHRAKRLCPAQIIPNVCLRNKGDDKMDDTTVEKTEKTVHRLIDAWSQHRSQAVDDLFLETGVYEDVAMGQVWNGRDEIKDFLKETFVAVPDFNVELTHCFSTTDMAACEWIMSGTQTGDFPAVPATGKSFSVRGASVVRLTDGMIKRWTDYYDKFTLLNQLGVVPEPESSERN